MITYTYTAKSASGDQIVKAEVQAESVSAASKLLIAEGLFPITIEDKEGSNFLSKYTKARIRTKDKIIFSRQLATLINAGLPLTQSLRTVKDQIANKSLQEIVDGVVASVEGGKSLSASFALYPKVFDHVYISLVQAGEATGTLDKALERIANQQEKDAAIVGKIRSALIYPAVILVVIIGVLIFMITTVLPQIASFFQQQGAKLPFFTELLNQLSIFLTHDWWAAIIIVAGAVYALRRFLKTERGISMMDNLKMNVPGFGIIFRKIYMARFARTLGTMLASGIPMLEGLDIVRQGIGNVHVAQTVAGAIERVKGGKALSSTLTDQPTFLPLVPQMILIGEQSGAMDQMLDRVATYYENEVDEEIKNISTLIEPVMMVIMGGAIGGVMAAILLPIYSLVGSGSIH
jgi:type IV pilus assembly protein PilC